MSEAAQRVYSSKYRPERDRDRMKLWMRDEREKNRAGYKSLTVTEWRKAKALMEMDELQGK